MCAATTYRNGWLCLAVFCFMIASCGETSRQEESTMPDPNLIHDLNRALTMVVSEDLFPPPVAARIYAYANITAYEALVPASDTFESLGAHLNEFPDIQPPEVDTWSREAALITSYTKVAKHLVYRGFMVDSMWSQAYKKYNVDPSDEAVAEGEKWGDKLADEIISWANADGYNATRNLPKYEPLKAEFAWEATAPMYGEALEPHWAKLRPFFMDSSSQFRLDLPVEFSTDENSDFYQSAVLVKDLVNKADSQDIGIAVYWDCNPGPTMVDGHKMQVRKQNTPGGHWMGIHAVIAKKQDQSLIRTARVYAELMAGIADGFIAAWDTKFHHHLLRPETYINRYIDADWKPKLESPLFPEFASAHSAISGVAASILDHHYGEVEFYDDTNVIFGLPPKSFDNVWQAAEEAANSRLLGGIHYKFGCALGLEQGKDIGKMIIEKVHESS
ncbi:MAG: vanadium-dependent haloperoxidase [Saprospiraceae bacterium]|nr:vanadium-dependent haloperoxidase [Saprospiraceae bacterium]